MPLPPEQMIYVQGLRALTEARVPFLVGGSWAVFSYLGQWRTTKDMDIFVAADRADETLAVLARAGFRTEVTDSAWLGKAYLGKVYIDVIFCSYNGLFPVDDSWFENAREANVLGENVRVTGPEEIIISKCFVAARDRFDGGDVSWLIRATGRALDWQRIERAMRDHWQVLLWQLMHFAYVFPAERRLVPKALWRRLLTRFRRELADLAAPTFCRGPMLDPMLYKREIEATGEDPRPRRELILIQAG